MTSAEPTTAPETDAIDADGAEPTDADGVEYPIDALAAVTGVPSRTIRYYQSKGTLPAPERRGRVAVYGPEHEERLEVIAELQQRGLRLDAIREVFDVVASGGDSLQSWLGVGDRLQAPWSDDRPQVWSHDELTAKVGPHRPTFITEAVRIGIIERRSNARPPAYLVNSPRLFDIALRLDEAGVDLETAVGAERILRRRIGKAADELVSWFSEAVGQGFGGSAEPDSIAEAFDVLRALGVEATQLIFAQEMERSLRDFVEKGGMVSSVKKAGKKKDG